MVIDISQALPCPDCIKPPHFHTLHDGKFYQLSCQNEGCPRAYRYHTILTDLQETIDTWNIVTKKVLDERLKITNPKAIINGEEHEITSSSFCHGLTISTKELNINKAVHALKNSETWILIAIEKHERNAYLPEELKENSKLLVEIIRSSLLTLNIAADLLKEQKEKQNEPV